MRADTVSSRYSILAGHGRKYLTDEIEFGPAGFITIVPLHTSADPDWIPKNVKMIIPVHFVQEITEWQPTPKVEPEPVMTDVPADAQS